MYRNSFEASLTNNTSSNLRAARSTAEKLILVIVFSLFSQLTTVPAYSTISPKKVQSFFQQYLQQAESDYYSGLSKAKSSYEFSLATKEESIRQAKLIILRNNQIRVLKLGENRNYWGNFNCPDTRPSCIYVDKGPKFEVGEIATVKEAVVNSPSNLSEIDLIVSMGLVELLNPKEFTQASRIIRDESLAIENLKKNYQTEQLKIESAFEDASQIEPALLAIKRALKNSSNFEKAFVVALKFDYNQRGLDELARLPFRYINSIKALDSAIKVTRLSEDADAVAASYSYSGALKINSICGKTFISETKFKIMYSKVSEVYKQATGRKLSP